DLGVIHDGRADALGDRDLVVGLHVDHGVHGLGGHGGDHVVDVHAHLLEVAFLEAGGGRDDVGENIADGGTGLVRDLASLELADLAEVEVLARHDLRGSADLFDLGDDDEAALVVADDEGLRGIGAEIHLPRHHLLHGEIAGGHGEFLELEAVLLEQAGFEQIVGRHPPDIGLKALADRLERPRASRREPYCQQAPREPLPSCQFNAPIGHYFLPGPIICDLVPIRLRGNERSFHPALAQRITRIRHCSCCRLNWRIPDATSSSVGAITCWSSSAVDDTAMEPAFSIIARYSAEPTIVAIWRCSRSRIGCGVPAPAHTPSQPKRTKSTPRPVSGGMAGRFWSRSGADTARILSCLASYCGTIASVGDT